MPDHQLPEVSLVNEEWDFSGCPEDELFDCWVYEFSREYHRRHGSIPNAWRIWFPLGADFPDTAYLKVSKISPNKEDVKLVAEFLKHNPIRPITEANEYGQPNICLKIDWRFSDAVLIKWMRLLLKEKRPKEVKLKLGKPPSIITALNRLGTYRLIKIEKLKSPQAERHTFETLGFALFSGYEKWHKACLITEKAIDYFPKEMASYA